MVEICSGISIRRLGSRISQHEHSSQRAGDPRSVDMLIYMLWGRSTGREQPVRLGLQSSKSPAFFLLILQVDACSPFSGERGHLMANTDEIPLS